MKKELDRQLCEKYPELFRGRHKSMMETLMCWGFECDDGWFEIIDNLCLELTEYCKKHDIEIPEVVQVKEKFGGLRFYLGGIHKDHFDAIYKIISKAEGLSYVTCEVCGLPGKPNKEGWIRTTCPEHVTQY
jgi:hypothetical protein